MFHRLCLHRYHNLHHTITQDEDTDKNSHLWPHGFWLLVSDFSFFFLISTGALEPKLHLTPFFFFSFFISFPQLTWWFNY